MNRMIFSSGMSRRADFLPALAADHHIGVDIQEMSTNAIAEIAPALVASKAHLFVDSGAFAAKRANDRALDISRRKRTKLPTPRKIDFAKTFARYHELAHAVCAATDDGGDEAGARLHFVMPDVVGDQDASLEVLRAFAEDSSMHNDFGPQPIIPVQAGKYTLVEFYDRVCSVYGNDYLRIGVPGNAAALEPSDLAELLEKRPNIWSVHVLGAASEVRAGPYLDVIDATGFDGDVSLDANRARTYWVHPHCTRKQGIERLLAGLPPLRAADMRAAA